MLEPIMLSDNTEYSREEYPHLYDFIKSNPKLGDAFPTTFKIKFVGALVLNGCFLIVIPKKLPITQDWKKTGSLIIHTLLKYRQTHQTDKLEIPTLFGSDEYEGNMISIMVEILEDYCHYGTIQRNHELMKVNGAGNPDWNRTVNKMIPVISNKGVIYPNIINRLKSRNVHDFIQLIHEKIINECLNMVGWFMGMEETLFQGKYDNISDHESLKVLKTELNKIFNRREIRLLKLMISYLEAKSDFERDTKIEIFAVPHFHVVWEAACGYITDNRYPLFSSLLPQPEYTGLLKDFKISQKPDIFSIQDSIFYIFDAKYYDYNKNVPGWKDLVKQYFYLYSLQSVSETNEFKDKLPQITGFKNALLLPGDSASVKYLGTVRVSKIEALPDIDVLAINEKYVLEAYAYNNNVLSKKIMKDIVHEIERPKILT